MGAQPSKAVQRMLSHINYMPAPMIPYGGKPKILASIYPAQEESIFMKNRKGNRRVIMKNILDLVSLDIMPMRIDKGT